MDRSRLRSRIIEAALSSALKALTDELQGYEKNIYYIYEGDEVTSYDFGLIASFPSSFKRMVKNDALEVSIGK